jgi:regulator of protease activity HflC (stomatin/prohibitin superfamily)
MNIEDLNMEDLNSPGNIEMGNKDYLNYLVEYINNLRRSYDIRISNILDELKKTHIKTTMSSAMLDALIQRVNVSTRSLQQAYADNKDDFDEKKISVKFEDEIINKNDRPFILLPLYKDTKLTNSDLVNHNTYYKRLEQQEKEEKTKYNSKRQVVDAERAEQQRVAERKAQAEADLAAREKAKADEEMAEAAEWEAQKAAQRAERDEAERAAAPPSALSKSGIFGRVFGRGGGTKRKTTTKRTSKKRRSKR